MTALKVKSIRVKYSYHVIYVYIYIFHRWQSIYFCAKTLRIRGQEFHSPSVTTDGWIRVIFAHCKLPPASNSNSAPSALVSLCSAAPLSSPKMVSPRLCWGSLGLASWLGLIRPIALKPWVTTINFIHCLARATRPFFRVTRAGTPSFWDGKEKSKELD